MNIHKLDDRTMMNKKDDSGIDEFDIEPCELEEFEDNLDEDESVIILTEEEENELYRVLEKKKIRNERMLAFLRVIFNLVVSILVIWIVLYFCK